MIIGVSPESYWDGPGSHERVTDSFLTMTGGVPVTTSPDAYQAAFKAFGNIKRIAVITPYLPVGDNTVSKFFTDNGIKKTSQSDADILLTTMFVFYADNINSDVVDTKQSKKSKALPSPKNIAYERILDSLIFNPERLNKEHLLFGQYDKLKGMLAKYQNIEKKNL